MANSMGLCLGILWLQVAQGAHPAMAHLSIDNSIPDFGALTLHRLVIHPPLPMNMNAMLAHQIQHFY